MVLVSSGIEASLSTGQHLAGARQLVGSVDAERHRRDNLDVDAHPRFEGAQLLKALALLQWRRRQPDETGQGGAPIGVEADMVVKRPVAPRRGGPGEVQRP